MKALKDNQKQFHEIVHLIKNAQNNAISSINVEMINLYWNVGQYISLKLSRAVWGDKTIDELAAFIQQKHPEIKGFNRRGLYRMKQFFEIYSSIKFVSSPMTQIQTGDNHGNKIVSSLMTQFEVSDIRETILTQCLVAFELKAEKFKPEHLGQLNFYLEALDRDVKKVNENPSIGILLCKDKDNEVVEYAMSRYVSPTMVSEYQTQLPDKKILQQKLRELYG